MAENQWGPKPFVKPPPSVFPAPAFWGPAEVPDQVRGQPRVDTWVNKDYSWEPPAVQSVQAGAHDSWVAPVIDQSFLSEPGEGSLYGAKGGDRDAVIDEGSPSEAGVGERYGAKGGPLDPVLDQGSPSAPGQGSQDTEGNFMAGYREQDISGEGTSIADSRSQDVSGEGTSIAEGRAQGAGEGDSWVGGLVRTQGRGEHESWVGGIVEDPDWEMYPLDPILKEFFPSEGFWGIGEHSTEGNKIAAHREQNVSGEGIFIASHRPQKGTGANPLNPYVRIQVGGDHDSWVGGEPGPPVDLPDFIQDLVVKQFFPSEGFWGIGPHNTEGSSIAGFREQGAGAAETFLDAVNKETFYSGETVNIALDKYAGSWNFEADIDGIPGKLNFLTISGVNSESEPIEFKFGTDPFKRSLPGVAKFNEVEMTRYHRIGSDDLWKWRQNVESGLIDIRNITLRLKHADNKTVVFSMTLHNCWPMKWDAPEMNAGGSEGAIEKITFKVSRVTKEVGDPGILAQIAGFIGSLFG